MLANNSLKRFELIKVGSYKYIVYKLTKADAYLLPVSSLLDSEKPIEMVPMIKVTRISLASHLKVDENEFLYLLNQTNPLVKEALYSFLKDEKE